MLQELRELLPKWQITRDGILYDIKRELPNGVMLHIPCLLTKGTSAEEVALGIEDSWEDACSRL